MADRASLSLYGIPLPPNARVVGSRTAKVPALLARYQTLRPGTVPGVTPMGRPVQGMRPTPRPVAPPRQVTPPVRTQIIQRDAPTKLQPAQSRLAHYEQNPPRDPKGIMELIVESARARRRVRIGYRKATRMNQPTEMVVEPYARRFKASKRRPGGAWYLYAYHPAHGSIHSLLISNIYSANPTTEMFSPRYAVEL